MLKDSENYTYCLSVLGQSPLFSSLDKPVIEEMLSQLRYETRPRGASAISSKEASENFYIIVRGRAKVSVYNPDNGREHILFLIGPGDAFDLISALEGQGHEAVATSLDDMAVLCTTVEQAREWLNLHPEFNRSFLPYLGRQMHELANQAADLSLYDTEARLSRLILRNVVNDKQPNDVQLIDDLSQETIASMIGSVRVVVTRHLQKWKQSKIISGKRGSWTVLDSKALLDKATHRLSK